MWMLLGVLLIAAPAVACDKGCEEHQGVCACEAPMEKPVPADEVQPSDERPRREQQPEWQTGEVKADMPPSEAATDALERDLAQAETDQTNGEFNFA